jgi:cell division protein FtsZ
MGGNMFTYVDNENSAKIKVIGVGGAGGNAINNMIASNLQGVKFIAANTDAQALEVSNAPIKIQIGNQLTEGLGAGANPEVGRQAAQESAEALKEALADSHMVFITAGFGGGTGTGASAVIAEICKELGALTVAVVTRPFTFEGRKRARQAEDGIEVLKGVADTVITIPNDRLRGLASKNATLIEMFKKADEVLLHSVKGITDLIMMPGLVNLDFADVRTTMSKAGMAIMGIGVASGNNRAVEAAERAISHPLLEDISISGAKGVLMNITSTSSLTMEEMTEASDRIYNEVGEDAEIIWGTVVDESLGDEMRVTVIATGIEDKPRAKANPRQNPRQLEPGLRGKVRDITPEDLAFAVDYDEPTFIRRKEAVGEGRGASYRGYKGLVIDNSDLEVPTFLRKKAD